MKLLLGVVYAIACLIVGYALGFTYEKYHLFIFLIANQFLLSFILYLRSNISGLHLFKTDSIISVTDRILLISLCSLLLFAHIIEQDFKIEWFVYAQTISYSITFIISFFIVFRKAGWFKLKLDYKFLFLILKQSYPFALLVLLMSLYTRVDLVMIENMLPNGAEQAGIYAQAYRILDAVSMFAYLFSTLLLPMFAKMIKQKESIAQLVKLSFLLLIVPASIFVIAAVFYSWEFMKLLYDAHYNESTEIFKVLVLGFIPIASSYIFGTLLTANNSLRQLNIMAVSGMLLNVILNIILIPKYQAWGAAIASLFTQLLTALLQIGIATHIFKLRINYKVIFGMSLYILVTCSIFMFGRGYLENWIINAAILCIIGFILAMAMRMINLRDLYRIVKYDDI